SWWPSGIRLAVVTLGALIEAGIAQNIGTPECPKALTELVARELQAVCANGRAVPGHGFEPADRVPPSFLSLPVEVYAGPPVDHRLSRSSLRETDHRAAAGLSLHRNDAEVFPPGKNKAAATPVQIAQPLVGNFSNELHRGTRTLPNLFA